jgi:hypothetical protein
MSAVGGLQGFIYLSVNRSIYRPICQSRASAPWTNIFIGVVSSMNVIRYIHRFHITDEYTVIFVSTNN